MTGSQELRAYTGELSSRLAGALGDELIGIWLMGSGALGGFDPSSSDVDVLVVSRTRESVAARQAVADLIGPPALPCPGQGLEFVWYALADVQPLGDPPAFQLNVNGGRARQHKVQFGPGDEADHWFVIDLAIGRAAAAALVGPALAEVAAPVPAERLLEALHASLAWHDGFDAGSPNRVLNAARTIRYLATGGWTNKIAAAHWLAERQPALAPALAAALSARDNGGSVPPALAAEVAEAARTALAAAVSGS
jgi:hypothetical protein